jgi:uncharacterized repeat protein (TIGR01451 family)
MKPNWLHWVIMVVGVIVLGAYWGVRAQESRSLFAPPAVLPKDEAPAPTVTKAPTKTATDAAPKQQGATGVVQVGGQAPPPAFPPPPSQPEEKGPGKLAPLLAIPSPEPAKVLIAEPTKKGAPEAEAPMMILPPPVVLPDSKKGSEIPPPTPPMPTVTMEPKKDAIVPPLIGLGLEPAKEPIAPLPIGVAPPATINPEMPQPKSGARAFVRIQSGTSDPPKVRDDAQRMPPVSPPGDLKVETPSGPSPVAPPTGIGSSGMLTLQTPNVAIEKRGPKTMRANETQAYQIVVRNLGPGPAQQIRIEDDLPPNVKIVSAEPTPAMEGNRATWTLSAVNANQDQTIRLTLQASGDVEITGRTSVHVTALTQTITTVLRTQNEGPRPQTEAAPLSVQLSGPDKAAVGKPVVFDVRVTNQSSEPLTGIVLHGTLSEGLTTPAGSEIVGEVDGAIPAGDFKILKMPATAVKSGRSTVSVKVVTNAGEGTATANIDIAAAASAPAPLLQQAPSARLIMGRDGDLRIELVNNTGKPLRNVTVADRLPEGLDFVDASDRGLYQGNSRTVYWLIPQMPVGKTQSLIMRVNGSKAGQHSHVVFAKADGVPEMQSTGVVSLEGHADLSVRVTGRDDLIEQGRETTYEIAVQNPGSAPAHNVKMQVQLSPGLTAKSAEGSVRFTLDRQTVLFDAIPVIDAKGQAVFRVSAIGQSLGDQRVRCAIVSDEVRVPIQREASTRVVEK